MTQFYSDLYRTPPSGGTPIYQGASGQMASGSTVAIRGTLTNPSGSAGMGGGTGDFASLCKAPPGAKLLRFAAVPSADLDASNSFTFNLGLTSLANAYVSASAGLQGTSAYELAAKDVINAAAAVDGDDLILTRVAGAWANAGSLSFVAEFYWP